MSTIHRTVPCHPDTDRDSFYDGQVSDGAEDDIGTGRLLAALLVMATAVGMLMFHLHLAKPSFLNRITEGS